MVIYCNERDYNLIPVLFTMFDKVPAGISPLWLGTIQTCVPFLYFKCEPF